MGPKKKGKKKNEDSSSTESIQLDDSLSNAKEKGQDKKTKGRQKPSKVDIESPKETQKPSKVGKEVSKDAQKNSKASSEVSKETQNPSKPGSDTTKEAQKSSKTGTKDSRKPSKADIEDPKDVQKPSKTGTKDSRKPSKADIEDLKDAQKPSKTGTKDSRKPSKADIEVPKEAQKLGTVNTKNSREPSKADIEVPNDAQKPGKVGTEVVKDSQKANKGDIDFAKNRASYLHYIHKWDEPDAKGYEMAASVSEMEAILASELVRKFQDFNTKGKSEKTIYYHDHQNGGALVTVSKGFSIEPTRAGLLRVIGCGHFLLSCWGLAIEDAIRDFSKNKDLSWSVKFLESIKSEWQKSALDRAATCKASTGIGDHYNNMASRWLSETVSHYPEEKLKAWMSSHGVRFMCKTQCFSDKGTALANKDRNAYKEFLFLHMACIVNHKDNRDMIDPKLLKQYRLMNRKHEAPLLSEEQSTIPLISMPEHILAAVLGWYDRAKKRTAARESQGENSVSQAAVVTSTEQRSTTSSSSVSSVHQKTTGSKSYTKAVTEGAGKARVIQETSKSEAQLDSERRDQKVIVETSKTTTVVSGSRSKQDQLPEGKQADSKNGKSNIKDVSKLEVSEDGAKDKNELQGSAKPAVGKDERSSAKENTKENSKQSKGEKDGQSSVKEQDNKTTGKDAKLETKERAKDSKEKSDKSDGKIDSKTDAEQSGEQTSKGAKSEVDGGKSVGKDGMNTGKEQKKNKGGKESGRQSKESSDSQTLVTPTKRQDTTSVSSISSSTSSINQQGLDNQDSGKGGSKAKRSKSKKKGKGKNEDSASEENLELAGSLIDHSKEDDQHQKTKDSQKADNDSSKAAVDNQKASKGGQEASKLAKAQQKKKRHSVADFRGASDEDSKKPGGKDGTSVAKDRQNEKKEGKESRRQSKTDGPEVLTNKSKDGSKLDQKDVKDVMKDRASYLHYIHKWDEPDAKGYEMAASVSEMEAILATELVRTFENYNPEGKMGKGIYYHDHQNGGALVAVKKGFRIEPTRGGLLRVIGCGHFLLTCYRRAIDYAVRECGKDKDLSWAVSFLKAVKSDWQNGVLNMTTACNADTGIGNHFNDMAGKWLAENVSRYSKDDVQAWLSINGTKFMCKTQSFSGDQLNAASKQCNAYKEFLFLHMACIVNHEDQQSGMDPRLMQQYRLLNRKLEAPPLPEEQATLPLLTLPEHIQLALKRWAERSRKKAAEKTVSTETGSSGSRSDAVDSGKKTASKSSRLPSLADIAQLKMAADKKEKWASKIDQDDKRKLDAGGMKDKNKARVLSESLATFDRLTTQRDVKATGQVTSTNSQWRHDEHFEATDWINSQGHDMKVVDRHWKLGCKGCPEGLQVLPPGKDGKKQRKCKWVTVKRTVITKRPPGQEGETTVQAEGSKHKV